jgi:HPt (histidine-containing phosphotransfer) domain-containing protein
MTLDFKGALARLGNDLSLFQEFIGFYEEDCPRLLANLRSAVADKDGEGVHHAAHGLRGLVASLGAQDVSNLAGALERMGRSRDFSDAVETFSKLEEEIGRLNTELSFHRPGASVK